jgi:hypothetical protein
MTVTKIENIQPHPNAFVKVKECGNVGEIISGGLSNRGGTIRKLNAEQYIVLSTGEVCDFKKGESRIDDTVSVRQSLTRLRDYLNTNVKDVSKCKWLTLTYAENQTDTKKLYEDFKVFNRKCRKKFGHYEYVVATEPQFRGAWHYHCILIFSKKAPFMENKTVAELWGKGFVSVRKLKGVDDIGRYLTAYLGDMTLEESGRLPANIKLDKLKIIETNENGVKTSKAIIKGARMALYPRGMNLYRISKGIKPPTVEKMENKEAEKKFADWALTYETTYKIEINNFRNIINRRYYNRLRKNERSAKNNEQHNETPIVKS